MLASLLFSFSCSDSIVDKQSEKNQSIIVKKISVRDYISVVNQSDFLHNNNHRELSSWQDFVLITYPNVGDVAIISATNDNGDELAIFIDENGNIKEEVAVNISKQDDIIYLKYIDADGRQTNAASFTSDWKLLSAKSDNALVGNSKLKRSFKDCTVYAIDACASDPGCALLCGITNLACIGAIMAACL